ncbi:MAG: hypothetical protein CFE23_04640 [Flavobacterium sp. BFFFF1]|uniref:hypothetical protein n=1 Tax=Flavobacterium sp. BFFFF1 TaxID=2015557 RepID=UPI000BD26C50|nr:hypothetical protein [Flavobacterium sp. BFFFF1]OYU81382.1 MAG: hypothetical protein CFE23_04640 [Flavobacterium sp. BFFFF1]
MIKRLSYINVCFALCILLSIVFQSVHEVTHYAEIKSERRCLHKNEGKERLTHQHHGLDHCSFCDFVFSNFISPDIMPFQMLQRPAGLHAPFPDYKEIIEHFRGSLFQLRGPPSFSV